MLRSRRGLLALVAASTCALFLVFGAPKGAIYLAQQKAAQRGLTAQIANVSFELRRDGARVWFKSVTLAHPDLPRATALLPFVEVNLGLGGLREVVIHGGNISIRGSTEEFADAVRKIRGGRNGDEPGKRRSSTPLRAQGIFVEHVPSPDESYHFWGVSLKRGAEHLALAADLVRLRRSSLTVESRNVVAEILVPELSLRSFSVKQTEAVIALEEMASLAADGTPPGPAGAPRPGAGSLAAGSGAPKAQSRWLSRFALSPGRGERWRRQLRRVSGMVARRLPANAELDFSDVKVRVAYGRSELNIGPGRFTLGQDSAAVFGAFVSEQAGQPGALGMEFSFRSPRDEGPLELSLAGGPISLSDLGVRENDFGLTHVDRARLQVRTQFSLSADGLLAQYRSGGQLQHLSLFNARIAPSALKDVDLSWNGNGEFAADGSRMVIRDGTVRLGAVAVNVEAELQRETERLVLNASADIPAASCQTMFASLPAALVGDLVGTEFSGQFSWQAGLALDTDQLSDIQARWRMHDGCRVERVPPDAALERFRRPFRRLVPDAYGELMEVESGPGSEHWVPIQAISRYLELAVTVTEDGRFWWHKGFDQRAIEGSIRQNLQSGQFVRGASTISMQLAKNLYLSRDKNVSRKVREALLTMLLEQELRKDEILELYFNVIEFGPGIYGIGQAAEYYFKSEPIDLSISQAFYLCSLLPNPKNSHFTPEGTLKPKWQRYLQRLMKIAHDREKLSDEELEEGLAQQLVFGERQAPTVPELPESGIPTTR